MDRTLASTLRRHFSEHRQMALMSGPRQVGKTTIALGLCRSMTSDDDPGLYLNWDDQDHRARILAGPQEVAAAAGLDRLRSTPPLCAFDELHEYRRWRDFMKGLFDTHEGDLRILVTGSARLDTFKRGGDSLMGRYFPYTLHPLSVAELAHPDDSADGTIVREPRDIGTDPWDALNRFGGFPEPLSKADRRFYTRWRGLRKQQLFREDVRDLTRVQEIGQLEHLADVLRAQVGQLTSYTSLAKAVRRVRGQPLIMIRIGPGGEQRGEQAGVAVLDGQDQRRPAGPDVPRVRVRARRQQRRHPPRVAVAGGVEQRIIPRRPRHGRSVRHRRYDPPMPDTPDRPRRDADEAAVPPLRDGDTMGREEFHRRYEAMCERTWAELIEGVVHLDRVSGDYESASIRGSLAGWIGWYKVGTPGLAGSLNQTILLDDRNEYQPAGILMIPHEAGGSGRVVDGFLASPPELACEVRWAVEAVDLRGKLGVYARRGLGEHLIVLPGGRPAEARWMTRLGNALVEMHPDPADGLLKSRVFPGLWLDADALLAGDLARLAAAVERGCATEEHAAFARRIAGA